MKRNWYTVIAAIMAFTLGIADAQAQKPERGEKAEKKDRGPRGEGGDRGPRGGFGGGRPDPEQMWGFIGKGKDSIDLNAPENEKMKQMMERMGRPIPANGILTKEAFIEGAKQRMEQGGAPSSSSPSMPTSSGSPSITPSAPSGEMDEKTKRTFDFMLDRYDKNKDGKLSPDEASSRMKSDFAKYDTNSDGFIDKTELRMYVEQFTGGGSRSGSSSSSSSSKKDDKTKEIVRPKVFRYGTLPDNVPKEIFIDLDLDHDGQVGLYEWRRGNKATSEFVRMDLNKDAYLTAEEWIRYSLALAEEK